MKYNTLKIRALIALVITLPAYPILVLIQNTSVSTIHGYAYAQYSTAVFVTLFLLFEFHNLKSRCLEKRMPWSKKFYLRLLVEISICIPVTSFVATGGYSSFYIYFWGMDPYFPSIIFYNTVGIFISLLFMAFVNSEYIINNWKSATLRAEKLERENTQAQLQALQNQLSPHFLFNNFNILNALMDEDLTLAKAYLNKLSEVFRYILQNKHNEVVLLSEEMAFIRNYAFLLKTRFQNKFQLKISVSEDTLNSKIPPVSLQVLIENALQHNEVSEKNPLKVHIEINNQHIVVWNEIKPKKGLTNGTMTGLSNISKRYGFLTETPVVINNNEHFEVLLPLIK